MKEAIAQSNYRRRSRQVLWAILVFLLGASFACSTTQDETKTGGGDEPPIRVKNGTFDLWLLGVTDGWALENGQSRVWKIPGKRRQSDFYVVVAVSDPKLCNVLDTTGPELTVKYSDDTQAEFKVTGNHTKVTVSKEFIQDKSEKARLGYAANDDAGNQSAGVPPRFIKSIELKDPQNTKMSCTFNNKEELHSLLILDY